MGRELPKSERRPEYHVCKNCEYIVVRIELPKPYIYNADYDEVPKERTWEEVDRVYETRYDCKPVPEGVRWAA